MDFKSVFLNTQQSIGDNNELLSLTQGAVSRTTLYEEGFHTNKRQRFDVTEVAFEENSTLSAIKRTCKDAMFPLLADSPGTADMTASLQL